MKSFNKYINMLNLVEILSLIVNSIIYKNFCFGDNYNVIKYMLTAIFFIVFFANIILGIINIKKGNKRIGILSIITGILPFGILLITFLGELLYFDSTDIIVMIAIIICILIPAILSILNIIFNKKLENSSKRKIPIIIFIFITLLNIAYPTFIIIIYNSDVNNLENSLYLMENEKNEKTYVINEGNKISFMDEEWNKITEKNYDSFNSNYSYNFFVNNNPINATIAKIDGYNALINTKGEVLLKTKNQTIGFISDMILKGKYKLKRYTQDNNSQATTVNFNVLDKYLETNKKYEDNIDCTYMYYKNSNFSNKILQIVTTNQLEEDDSISGMFDKYYLNYDINIDKTKDFYKHKKLYYLIDFEKDVRTQLNCNNLIYLALDNSEKIALFSNGNIPFYDKNETGFFDNSGKKISLSQPYLIYDCTDKYIIVIDRNTSKTLLVSNETGNVVNEYNGIINKYKNFYICSEYEDFYNGLFTIFDNNFNKITESTIEPIIVDAETIVTKGKDNLNYIYSYKDGDFEVKYSSSSNYFNVKCTEIQEQDVCSNNIYSNIWIDIN